MASITTRDSQLWKPEFSLCKSVLAFNLVLKRILNERSIDFEHIQSELGYKFSDVELLNEALTHSSCLNEPSFQVMQSNEALAWLGDAVIYWVVSEALYDPKLSKESLTEARKKFIEAKDQARLARKLGLDKALRMPEGQEKEGGRSNPKNLHTVYEAVVGAIYRDSGYCNAKKFCLSQMN